MTPLSDIITPSSSSPPSPRPPSVTPTSRRPSPLWNMRTPPNRSTIDPSWTSTKIPRTRWSGDLIFCLFFGILDSLHCWNELLPHIERLKALFDQGTAKRDQDLTSQTGQPENRHRALLKTSTTTQKCTLGSLKSSWHCKVHDLCKQAKIKKKKKQKITQCISAEISFRIQF